MRKKAVDIRDTYIEAVEQDTWLRNDITPYEMYLKTLYEFFKDNDIVSSAVPYHVREHRKSAGISSSKRHALAFCGSHVERVVPVGASKLHIAVSAAVKELGHDFSQEMFEHGTLINAARLGKFLGF